MNANEVHLGELLSTLERLGIDDVRAIDVAIASKEEEIRKLRILRSLATPIKSPKEQVESSRNARRDKQTHEDRLAVAVMLASEESPMTTDEISKRCGWKPAKTRGLLNCGGTGVYPWFIWSDEDEWSLTDAGKKAAKDES